jgi:urease accessory protein
MGATPRKENNAEESVVPETLDRELNGIYPRSAIHALTDYVEHHNSGLNDADNQWLLWQLADSAFPTGGFVHSGGLEAAVQQGELRSVADLSAFIEASLLQLGHASLAFMSSAHHDPAKLVELDALYDCFTTNHVANRASRLQGQAMLASANRIFPSTELQTLRESGVTRLAFNHLPPIFGVTMRALGFSRMQAARLFFFIHMRGLISSAVRLGIVGPLQAQALQHSLSPRGEEILLQSRNVPISEIAQTAPLLDLWQANQDRLYSRLFQS